MPDIDVTIEQIPGDVRIDSPSGGFDAIELDLGKQVAKTLQAERLPRGWTLEIKGKTARLSGPELAAGVPVRLVLDAGDAPRPEKISYRVLLDGDELLARRNETVELVPQRQVIGTLSGVVTMPTLVAPGETMMMRIEDPTLPPDGTWTLSGTVTDDEDDDAEAERTLALIVPRGSTDEIGATTVEDAAAVLAASGIDSGSWEIRVENPDDPALEEAEWWAVARTSDSPGISNILKTKHDTAKNVIRNVKAIAAPSGGEGVTLVGVRPGDRPGVRPIVVLSGIRLDADILDDAPTPPLAPEEGCKSSQASQKCCEAAGGSWDSKYNWCWEKLETEKCYLEPIELPADTSRCVIEGFSIASADGGDRIHEFVVHASGGAEVQRTILDTTRSHLMVGAAANADGTVLIELPADLRPGDRLALTYTDRYGDVIVDVPSVPDVEVVAPATDDREHVAEVQTPVIAGTRACVCGHFPTPEHWQGLLLDGRPIAPLSASSRMVWLEIPADSALGEHTVSGNPEAGFSNGERTLDVIAIRGELDSRKLQRQETTPMRLWVEGTEQPVRLRIVNRTPSIVQIEGGEEQVVRTSGGEPNAVDRPVTGLTPGDFDIQYELAEDGCPCGARRSGSDGGR